MSPEQARGEESDERTDVFSYGVMLYELLSGEALFRGANATETVSAILKDPVPKMELAAHGGRLKDIVDKCLCKERDVASV